jgi:hypothetical protein
LPETEPTVAFEPSDSQPSPGCTTGSGTAVVVGVVCPPLGGLKVAEPFVSWTTQCTLPSDGIQATTPGTPALP